MKVYIGDQVYKVLDDFYCDAVHDMTNINPEDR